MHSRDQQIEERERQIMESIYAIRDGYQRTIQPLVDELARLRSLKAPEPMIIGAETWQHIQNSLPSNTDAKSDSEGAL